MLEGSSRGADEHGSAAAESDASEFLPARLLWAHEAEGSAADYHNYGAGHRLSREASSSEEREELVSELGEGLVGQDGVTHAPQQVHQAPIADWWEDGRGNREQESAAAAVLSEWLHDYLCEADGTEASAKYLALLASSAQRNAALAACHSQEPGRPQPAVCSRDQTGRERQAMRHSSLRQPAGSAQQHQPQAKESIRERRLREDLEQRAAEEAAELAFRFQATPLPQSTAEPRCTRSHAWASAVCCMHAWYPGCMLLMQRGIISSLLDAACQACAHPDAAGAEGGRGARAAAARTAGRRILIR